MCHIATIKRFCALASKLTGSWPLAGSSGMFQPKFTECYLVFFFSMFHTTGQVKWVPTKFPECYFVLFFQSCFHCWVPQRLLSLSLSSFVWLPLAGSGGYPSWVSSVLLSLNFYFLVHQSSRSFSLLLASLGDEAKGGECSDPGPRLGLFVSIKLQGHWFL